MLKELFASVGIFLAGIFGSAAPAAPIPSALNQPASAIVALSDAPDLPASATSPATTTIINQYITQPLIEREVSAPNAVTHEELTASLAALRADLLSVIANSLPKAYTFAYPASAAPVSTQTFALSQRIDKLANLTISNATVSGVTGLTDADIPDGITASNYLPLSGGTIAAASSSRFSIFDKAYFGGAATSTFDSLGSLTLAGTFTVSTTTATSTFAGPISTANPTDVYDDFSGTAGGDVPSREPIVGSYAWSTTGAGYLGAYAGAGTLGSTGGNTYFVMQSSRTPWEVTTTFSDTDGAPTATISVVKDYTNHAFSVMWHANFNAGGTGQITMTYWNDTWNGGSTVTNAAPTFHYQAEACPTLSANTSYVARIVFNAPWVDASIETSAGTVLCTARAYDSLVSSILGPYTYIQSGDSTQIYHSFRISNKPSSANLNYGRSINGLEGTPIGQLAPAAANFSSAHIGLGRPKGVFSVTWDGTAGVTPGIFSNGAGGFIVGSNTSGYGSTLSIKNGAGGTGTITMDGLYALSLAGNSGAAFLTKPANAALPYFTSGLGVATTSPWRTFSITGTVGFDGLTGSTGAGSLCLTANREVVYNSASDACLPSLRDTKHEITSLSLDALQIVEALDPVSFVYNDSDGRVRYGFIAEDAAAVDSHLVTYSASGTLSGIDDRSIISIVVKAIKELWTRSQDYFARTERLENEVNALEARIAALEGSQAAAASAGSSSIPQEGGLDTEPPVITINGNNPATLQVGDAYSDLGATVTDNVDLNLGYQVFVGSTPLDQAHIDTSEPNEWHIHYVATDSTGNTATSTRTVIVEAGSDAPVTAPALDTASTTAQ